jgi:hypothetical protein
LYSFYNTVNLPPDATVRVTPDATVRGPAQLAFSVAAIVVLALRDCTLVLNTLPPLNVPLLTAGGVIVAVVKPRKLTKILAVPLEGAGLNVRVVPFDTAYAEVSCITPSTDTRMSWSVDTVWFKVKAVVLASPLNCCTVCRVVYLEVAC